jgi:alpha-galactosidase
MRRQPLFPWSAVIAALLAAGCGTRTGGPVVVEGVGIRLELDTAMASRVVAASPEGDEPLGAFRRSEYLILADGNPMPEVEVVRTETTTWKDQFGSASRTVVIGEGTGLRKQVAVDAYPDFPGVLLVAVSYTNLGADPLKVRGWVNHHHELAAGRNSSDPPFWAYLPASYEDRRDWIRPVTPGFRQDNFLGMNGPDYGGGTPVCDLWRRDLGMAVGHVETVPRLVSLPVAMAKPDTAEVAVTYSYTEPHVLASGETLTTFRTMIAVHRGDFFTPLSWYRRLMAAQGLNAPPFPASAYEPTWCAWGYERDFTLTQVLETLPKVRELGLGWAVLDDGWQIAEGDWRLNPSKFPHGEADMKRLTATIHEAGLRAKLWWAPMSADPGTELLQAHPEYLLLDSEGRPQKISWWDAWYLCPAYPPVRRHTLELVRKIIDDWGFDGLKIDGQYLNAAPPCYNPAHQHQRPEESVEAVPVFFREIYAEATGLKPDPGMEICPCGTSYSFFSMPYMNQPVASDPLSSWQVRLKGKAIKALMGSHVPYFGDHVELSDGGEDFASTVGIGAIPSTKFTWPVGAKPGSTIDLTPAREAKWKKWLDLYREKMLPLGEYRGDLYDLGFDRPEAHAILKDDHMYYAFYAPSHQGAVELRGLGSGTYRVVDYVAGTPLGTVQGPVASLEVSFTGSLLLEAIPQ